MGFSLVSVSVFQACPDFASCQVSGNRITFRIYLILLLLISTKFLKYEQERERLTYKLRQQIKKKSNPKYFSGDNVKVKFTEGKINMKVEVIVFV